MRKANHFQNANFPLDAGVYSVSEAVALTHVSPARISDWLRLDQSDGQKPIWEPMYASSQRRGMLLSFNDVVQLKIVKVLRDEKITMRRIRKAIEVSLKDKSSFYPFLNRKFQLCGREVYTNIERYDEYTRGENVDDGQAAWVDVFPHERERMERVWHALEALEFDETDLARRWWPDGRGQPIVVDPSIEQGRPIIDGKGIRVEIIIRALKNYPNDVIVAEGFGLTIHEVLAAKSFAQKHELRAA